MGKQRALGWLVLGLGLVLVGAYAVWPHGVQAAHGDVPELAVVHVAPLEHAQTDVLRKGQTLSDVLTAEGLRSDMPDLLLALRQYADPRRLSPGVEITVRRWSRDSTTRAVDIRLNADTTVSLMNNPVGWDGHVEVTPVHADTVFIAGTITHGQTLYEALVGDDQLNLPVPERVQLVATLADIYGYKLDFAHEIRAGDTFRVVYEREERPDGTARSRRVLAADIVNQGENFDAIYFKRKDQPYGHYYDEKGKSLRLAFRRYPVAYVRITSNFSWHRYHPILGIYRAHTGTDFGAKIGTPVMATADGVVIFAGRDDGYGNLIKLRHFEGYTTRYAHLHNFARGIHRGVRVKQGQVIGYVGETGLATGPHVHYEIRRYGRPMNPRTVRLPGAPPIPSRYLAAFHRVAKQRLALLDRVTPSTTKLAAAADSAKKAAGSTQEQ